MTHIESHILEIMNSHKGRENAITRNDLRLATGENDRKNRDVIAELYQAGHIIISLKKGYFLGTVEDDIKYRNREFKRLRTQSEKLKGHFPKVWEAVNQLSLL